MSAPESLRRELFERAGGCCECTEPWCWHHDGGLRCSHPLKGGWSVHRVNGSGPYSRGNCIALCSECNASVIE